MYLSLYHGYYYICTKIEMYESFGYTYSDIHDNPKYEDKPLRYDFLRRKRIHNMKYYNMVGLDSEGMKTYMLKQDACVYKKGATKERKDMLCVKIL
jgi:hypothetical protein